MNVSAVWSLVKETFSDWSEDRASRLAAALSYYTIFSIAPLLIIVTAIAGLVLDPQDVRGAVSQQLEGLFGSGSAEVIQEMIARTGDETTGIIATVIGIVTLLLGASGVFGELQSSLNTIWEVMPKPGRGFMGMIKDRFLSFTMVLGTGFLLLVSLALSAGLAALGTWFTGILPGSEWVLHIINFIISFGVITLLFAMIYKVLPDVEIAWSDVWIGAAVTALLFTIGKLLIGLYIGKSSVGSAYGAAGSLVVILVWIYYSVQILFLGAEFTQVYARRYGSRIKPSADAVMITEEARAQQGMPSEERVQQVVDDQQPRDQRTARQQARVPETPQVREPRRPLPQALGTAPPSAAQPRRRPVTEYIAALFWLAVNRIIAGLRGARQRPPAPS